LKALASKLEAKAVHRGSAAAEMMKLPRYRYVVWLSAKRGDAVEIF
jgi:hypothetical protein